MRTVLVVLGAALCLFFLGRLLLPLAVLLAAATALVLWSAPEIAYWADDVLHLHRLPAFGTDHRQMAITSFAGLALAAIVGNVMLTGLIPTVDRNARAATIAPAQAGAHFMDVAPAAQAAPRP